MGPAFDALLVDYGGVLTVPEEDVFEAFARDAGVDPSRLPTLVASAFDGSDPDGPIARRERGELSLAAFERWLAAVLSDSGDRSLDPRGLCARLFRAERIDGRMVDLIRHARAAGVRTGMVSNTWGEGDDQERLADLFDAVVLSGRVGSRKPERAIFVAALDALGVEAGRCVFVDDVQANVAAAEGLGMRAVLHRDAPGTVRLVEELLGIGPRSGAGG